MEFSQYQDRLREFIGKQDVEWETYLEWFRVANPEPVLRECEKKFVEAPVVNLNIKFWLALISGIGALALSAFRVSERFYTVAGGDAANPFFSRGEAISAVAAVNITVFALAIAIAYTKGKMSEGSQTWGLGTAVTISAIAGLGQAIKYLGTDYSGLVSFMDVVLAFVLGIGASALEYFSGDLLGVEIVRFFSEKSEAWNRYRTELVQTEQEFTEQTEQNEREFTEQHKLWVRSAKSQFGLWKANFVKWNEQTEQERTEQVMVGQNQTKQNRTRSGGQTFSELVRSVLETNYQQNQTVLSFSELSSVLCDLYAKQNNVSEQNLEQFRTEFVQKKKAQISELRTKWIEQNKYTV